MNIQTVAQNLSNTIADKQMLADLYRTVATNQNNPTGINAVLATFVQTEVNDLQRILQDVEQCIEKDVEQSWRDNPDRSGGQFTQDEIDNAGEWR